MLDLLVKYALDHGLEPEPGFKPKDVRWAIVCDEEGRFLDVIELGDASQKKNPGQAFPKCPDLSLGEMIAGGVIRSHFLVDTAEVVSLHFDKKTKEDDNKISKVREKHTYFVNLLSKAGSEVTALARLAEGLKDPVVVESIRQRLERLKAKPTDKITLKLGGCFPLQEGSWHDWWREFRKSLSEAKPERGRKRAKSESARLMRCLASGAMIEPIPTHPKIEKLADVGGMPAGDVLIGFDKDSFRSYGLEQSANAAVSEQSAAAYRSALNKLIKDHGYRLAGAKVVHWFKNKDLPPEDDPMAWLIEGVMEQERNAQRRARELIESIRDGKRIDLLDNYFYALTLSGASGRVMVRDWMEGQFEELAECVFEWFDDLSIVCRDGSGLAGSPKFLAVLGATVRELDNLTAQTIAKMWRVATRGEPIPLFALAQALMRAKVGIIQDESFNHARMGLLKAYHIRIDRKRGEASMVQELKPCLNEDHPHSAYQCGRLMAVLASLQHAALGDVGAGVVQRYYASASSTPALVLGRLTRTSQFHLNKLEGGLAYWYESKIASIWGHIKDQLPRTLALEEQSLFALGYYQQLADIRTKKSDDLGTKTTEVRDE